jgi:hypothetical protein
MMFALNYWEQPSTSVRGFLSKRAALIAEVEQGERYVDSFGRLAVNVLVMDRVDTMTVAPAKHLPADWSGWKTVRGFEGCCSTAPEQEEVMQGQVPFAFPFALEIDLKASGAA